MPGAFLAVAFALSLGGCELPTNQTARPASAPPTAVALAAPPAPAAAPILSPPPAPVAEQPTFHQAGMASWYGKRHQGARTATGDRFDSKTMTAAHRTLPIGTIARVTNPKTGETVKVRINDRGPHRRDRIIDVSQSAALALGIHGNGIGQVEVAVFDSDQPPPQPVVVKR